MNYWIFQVNSEAFLVDQFLNSDEKGIWWRVTRFKNEIKKGDFVFFWQSGIHRGIRAVWRIDHGPSLLPREVTPSKFWVKPDRKLSTTDLYAKCIILQHFPVIEENLLKREPGLRDLSIFGFRNATNYPVTFSESKLIRSMIRSWTGELNDQIPSSDLSQQDELIQPAKAANAKPTRKKSTSVTLFQCGACKRYIIASDRDRHIHQAHKGEAVGWIEVD